MKETNNVPVKKERYSWEDKVAVATKYMALGNMRLVSEITKVPYQTIADWRKTDWWPNLCDEIKQIKRSKMGAKLEEVIDLSVSEVHDRLINGDWILNQKTGELRRKPVSLRDAAQVTNQLITRQLQMEELADKLTNRKESIKETLAMLSKEFAKLTREQQKKQAEIIEYRETSNAVQIEEADEVDVSEETRNGEGMGGTYSESESATQ